MPALTATDASDLFRRPPDRLVDVGAGEVAHRRVGEGPDVLFVHGWPMSGATFRGLLPHLVDHVTCHLIDLPGAGASRFDADTPLSMQQHITTVQRVVDELGLDSFAAVGHDSGGLIARHALAGDPRCRAMGLVNTEQPGGLSWRFRLFLAPRRLPGVGAVFGAVAGAPRLRRNKFFFGDAFEDRSHLDGDFDELFLRPLHDSAAHRDATVRLLRAFDTDLVHQLDEVHRRIDVSVQLVWGDRDPFFPIDAARAMVETFPDARLDVIEGGRLMVHEERPAEVAAALLPVLAGRA